MKAEITSRIRLLIFIFLGIAFALIFRLYLVQIVKGEEYAQKATRQYSRPNQSLYDRGYIFFSDKDGNEGFAASLDFGYTVAISPVNLGDAQKIYGAISGLIDINSESFFLKAGKKDDPYEEIAERVPEEKALAIADLKLKGVNIYEERWRSYPSGKTAANVLGFVGFEGDKLTGRYGLEKYYEDILKRDSQEGEVNFFAEIFSGIKEAVTSKDIKGEGSIITTIEPKVQDFLEKTVASVENDWHSDITGGIVINPKNGEVYAMSMNPTFDPNIYNEEKNISIFSNPIVEDVYEMGSIIKALTMAAGLDSGAVTADTTYYDNGFIELDGATVSNYDGKGRGQVNMQEVLNQSLNTGAAFVESQIGNKKFKEYFLKFGLGDKTDIDLPNETTSLIDNLDSPRNLEFATASFGQGVAFTPIMTVRALAALGNGGYLIKPHVTKEIKYKIGLREKFDVEENPKRAIKETASDEITRMLVRVVDEALLGGDVALPNYSIAAKTGTAQIANPNGGGYYENRYLHSFFGYFPAYDPQFLVFFYTVDPKGVRYASQTLTYPFIDMAKFLISYYEVAPDR